MSTGMIAETSISTPDMRRIEILKSNLGNRPISERDLTTIPFPLGGATTWCYQSCGNEVTTEELVGLIVGVGDRGELWPTTNPSDSRPVIVSNDLITGYRVGDDLGDIDPEALERFRTGERTYDWAAMSNSAEFGFSSQGAAKRLKERVMLALLMESEVWPVLVKIPPASTAGFREFLRKLPCFRWECTVGLRLVREKNAGGQPFSRLSPRVVSTVSPEVGEVYRQTYCAIFDQMFSAPPLAS